MSVTMHEGSHQHTHWKSIRFRWTADESGGTFLDFFCYGEIFLAAAKPGGTDPTPKEGYSIFIEDEDGIDLLDGLGKALSADKADFIETVIGTQTRPIAVGRHMFRVTGAGAGATGTFALFIKP